MNTEAAAGEIALKTHVLCDPEMLDDSDERNAMRRSIADSVDLTEAPEDAVCSLVIDLMHYCDRERIDWSGDVISRARDRFDSDRRELHAR